MTFTPWLIRAAAAEEKRVHILRTVYDLIETILSLIDFNTNGT